MRQEKECANCPKWKIPVIVFCIIGIFSIVIMENFDFSSSEMKETIIPYQSGAKSIRECIEISNRYLADKADTYRLFATILASSKDKDMNKADTCMLTHIDIKGEKQIYTVISSDRIVVQESSTIISTNVKVLKNSPDIVDFTDFYEIIRLNPEFAEDVDLALEEQDIQDLNKVLSGEAVTFKDGRYVWWVTVYNSDNIIRYLFDAETGEFVKRM